MEFTYEKWGHVSDDSLLLYQQIFLDLYSYFSEDEEKTRKFMDFPHEFFDNKSVRRMALDDDTRALHRVLTYLKKTVEKLEIRKLAREIIDDL